MAKARGDVDGAWTQFEESLALYRIVKDQWGIAISLSNLGGIACERGDRDVARALFEESLVMRQELGDRRGIAESLEGLGAVACALGHPERAARLWGAAERLHEELGAPMSPLDRRQHTVQVAAARSALGDDAAFAAAWQQGRAMVLERAVTYALEGARR